MASQRGFSLLAIVVPAAVLALLVLAVIVAYFNAVSGDIPEAVVCTQDVKLCPDGSYVSRVAPNCEFAQCP